MSGALKPSPRLFVRMGEHILIDALEFLADRIVLVEWPVSGEDVVGPLAEQQIIFAHDDFIERAFAPVGLDPSAEAKAARWC